MRAEMQYVSSDTRGDARGDARDDKQPEQKHRPASLEEARAGVVQVLQRCGSFSLASSKALFASVLQLQLSETFLGFSHLRAMFESPQFSDVCIVEEEDGVDSRSG